MVWGVKRIEYRVMGEVETNLRPLVGPLPGPSYAYAYAARHRPLGWSSPSVAAAASTATAHLIIPLAGQLQQRFMCAFERCRGIVCLILGITSIRSLHPPSPQ